MKLVQRPAMYSSMKVFVSVHLLSFMMSSKRAFEILECSMMQQGSRAITYIDTYNVRPPRYLSWFITPITMVYGTYNTIATGAYKPTFNWGASHCTKIADFSASE